MRRERNRNYGYGSDGRTERGDKRESTRMGLNACWGGRCSRRDWCQMDKEAVERMHEITQSAGRLADRVNCPRMEKEMRCTRPREVQRNNSAESYYEILERILDKRLRERVEYKLREVQLGFRKGRGTTDLMFALRQLVEKRLERQGNMVLAFVDLEFFFTLLRENGNGYSEMDGITRIRSKNG